MINPILAEIITIGDEILFGQIIDTNSSWIGGIKQNWHSSIEASLGRRYKRRNIRWNKACYV